MDLVAVSHYTVSHELCLRLTLGFVGDHRNKIPAREPHCDPCLIGLPNTTRRLVGNTHGTKLDEMSGLAAIMADTGVTIL